MPPSTGPPAVLDTEEASLNTQIDQGFGSLVITTQHLHFEVVILMNHSSGGLPLLESSGRNNIGGEDDDVEIIAK